MNHKNLTFEWSYPRGTKTIEVNDEIIQGSFGDVSVCTIKDENGIVVAQGLGRTVKQCSRDCIRKEALADAVNHLYEKKDPQRAEVWETYRLMTETPRWGPARKEEETRTIETVNEAA